MHSAQFTMEQRPLREMALRLENNSLGKDVYPTKMGNQHQISCKISVGEEELKESCVRDWREGKWELFL